MENFKELYKHIGKLSYQLFPEATSYEHILKLKIEADEVLEDLDNVEEYADCFFALIAAANKAGISCEDFILMVIYKSNINSKRVWIKQPDGTHQHDRQRNKKD